MKQKRLGKRILSAVLSVATTASMFSFSTLSALTANAADSDSEPAPGTVVSELAKSENHGLGSAVFEPDASGDYTSANKHIVKAEKVTYSTGEFANTLYFTYDDDVTFKRHQAFYSTTGGDAVIGGGVDLGEGCDCLEKIYLYSGYIGTDEDKDAKNIKWELNCNTGVLKLSGTGPIRNCAVLDKDPDSNLEYDITKFPWFSDDCDHPTELLEGDYIVRTKVIKNKCRLIKTVIIDDGITNVPDHMFDATNANKVSTPSHDYQETYVNLRNVYLGNTIKNIGEKAFCSAGSNTLENYHNSDSYKNLTFIQRHVHDVNGSPGVADLGSLDIISEKTPTKIENNTSTGGKDVEYYDTKYNVLPDSVETIGDNAFTGMSGGNKYNDYKYGYWESYYGDDWANSTRGGFVLSENLKSIGNEAFYAAALSSVDFSKCKQLESIGDSAFGQNRIPKFDFPDTITEFGTGVCACNWDMEFVHLPSGLTEIPDYTFACDNLPFWNASPYYITPLTPETFQMPPNVTKIGKHAFEGVARSGKWSIPDGQDYVIDLAAPLNFDEVMQTYFPNVTELDDYSFYDNTFYCPNYDPYTFEVKLDSLGEVKKSQEYLVIPDGITSVGSYAFAKPNGLKYVVVPTSVKYLSNFSGVASSSRIVSKILYLGTIKQYNSIDHDDELGYEEGTDYNPVYNTNDKTYAIGVKTLPATDITIDGFTANWTADEGCFGYELVVSTKPIKYSSGIPSGEIVYHIDEPSVEGRFTPSGVYKEKTYSYRDHNSFKVTGLKKGVTYYYAVRPYDVTHCNTADEELYGDVHVYLDNTKEGVTETKRETNVRYALPSNQTTVEVGYNVSVSTDIKGATLDKYQTPAGDDYSGVISVSKDNVLPEKITVKVGDVTLTEYQFEYNKDTGVVTVSGEYIQERTDNILISAKQYHPEALVPVTKKTGHCDVPEEKTYYHCDDCNKDFSDEEGTELFDPDTIPDYDPNHKLTYVEAEEGDCISGALDSHYECDYCGKIFEDADGKNEVDPGILKHHKYQTYFAWKNSHGMPGRWVDDVWYQPQSAFDASLQLRCSVCGRIEESIPAKVEYYGDIDESYPLPNYTYATATAEFRGKTYTDKHYYRDSCYCYFIIPDKSGEITGYTKPSSQGKFQPVNGYSDRDKYENYGLYYFDAVSLKANEPEEGMKFEGWYECRQVREQVDGVWVTRYEKVAKVSDKPEFVYYVNKNWSYLVANYVEDDSVKNENPLTTSIMDQLYSYYSSETGKSLGRTYIDKNAGTTQVTSVMRWELKQMVDNKAYRFKEAGIVRSYTDTEPTLEKYDNNVVRKQASKLTNYTGTYQYTLKMTKKYINNDIYIRGYVIYADDATGEEHTVYTDVLHYDPMT